MDHSPKLKRVMEDVKALLLKEDIAAVVVLHEPGFSDCLMLLQPSYSCATEENNVLEIKMDVKHFENAEDQQTKLTSTCNMLAHLGNLTSDIGAYLRTASGELDKVVEATHHYFKHATHNKENS